MSPGHLTVVFTLPSQMASSHTGVPGHNEPQPAGNHETIKSSSDDGKEHADGDRVNGHRRAGHHKAPQEDEEDEDEERDEAEDKSEEGSYEDEESGDEEDEDDGDEEEDEEEDEDDDEEPALKYERITGAIPDLLKKDSASALAISHNIMVWHS